MMGKAASFPLVGVPLLLLSGCVGSPSSSEAAAIQMLNTTTGTDMVVNPDSVKLHPPIRMSGGKDIVSLTFEGFRPQMGPVTCIYTYEISQRSFAPSTTSGGGTCRPAREGEAVQEIEIVGGRHGGEGPEDLGHSLVSGYVNNPEIEKVHVTWDDNIVTESEVMDSTFVAVHSGEAVPKIVEGFNNRDEVVYSFFPAIPPDARP